MSQLPFKEELENMRRYFQTGATRSYAFRKEQLEKFKRTLLKYEKEIQEALHADLKKSEEESWVTETGFLLTEINATIKHLKSWMRPEIVSTNLFSVALMTETLSLEPLAT